MFKRFVFIEGLTSLIGSNGKYLINNKGQIKDITGDDIPYTKDENGHKVVNCLGWAGEKDYRVIDLVALQFKGLQIPVEDYDKVIAFAIDGNKDNTHASNIGYRFKNGKLEFKELPGFYYVPGFPNVAINTQGESINVKTLSKRKYSITPSYLPKNITGGYAIINTSFTKGITIHSSRHRMLCLVFKEYPDNVDSMTVNHINGVPGDDRLENLEWVTRGQNNLHAYVNDLKSQHMRVLVRNVLTNEITEYYSISECARQLGYPTDETIRQRIITSKFGQVFQDGTQIKLKSDTRPWVDVHDPHAALKAARQRIPIQVRDCASLSIKEFASVSDASKSTGVNHATINYRLIRNNLEPCFGFQFKYIDDTQPFPNFTKQEYVDSLINSNIEIHARNLLTGEQVIFDSINKAITTLDNSHIGSKLRQNEQALLESGWQLKLPDWEWEDIPNFEEAIYKLKKDIMAKHVQTGTIYLASNSAQLAQDLKLDPKAIRKAAFTRGNAIYRGYRFRLGISNEPWPDTILPSQ